MYDPLYTYAMQYQWDNQGTPPSKAILECIRAEKQFDREQAVPLCDRKFSPEEEARWRRIMEAK